MDSVTQISEAVQRILGEEATELAREVGFIKRERNFDGADFAQSLVFGWLQGPQETLDGMTQVMQRRHVSMSAAGLSQRFTEEAATFFEQLLSRLTQQHLQAEAAVPTEWLARFSAVYLEDSSTVSLPSELAEVWRGCGGSRGKNAAVKLCCRWEVKRGQLQGPSLMEGRRSDQRSALSLTDLPQGSLYLADLGYFSLRRLCLLCGRAGASRGKARRYFLSRYHSKSALLTRQGQALSLWQVLPKRVGERKECLALLGKRCRLPVRLLMERVPPEVAEARRERVREAAADHGRQADEYVLWLCDWTILLTNVPRRLLSLQEALVFLRLRWQIERLFRLWKEHGRIDEWRSKKPWRILCELYAKLCAMLIQQWLIVAGTWHDAERSLVKAAQVVRREAGSLMEALYEGRLEVAVRRTLDCMQSGCRLNRRKQQPSTAQLLQGAPLPTKKRPCPPQYRHRGAWQRWPAGHGWADSRYQARPAVADSP
jgi:hypothetical protein